MARKRVTKHVEVNGKTVLMPVWEDTGEAVTKEEAAAPVPKDLGQEPDANAAAAEEGMDEDDDLEPESTEGQLCDICGAGPFKRLATHKAKAHAQV